MDVIGFGAMNMDRLYRVERFVHDGEAAVEEFVLQPGGSAANTIYGLARLGVKAGFLGAVGEDEDGKALLESLKTAGADASHIKTKPGAHSGSVLCLSDGRGDRALYAWPGANSLLEETDLDVEYLRSTRMVHLSPFVGDAQWRLQLGLAHRLPPTIELSFAPGSLYARRGWEAIAPLIARARVLFLNAQELRELTGQELAAGAQRCLAQGCHLAVITLGQPPPPSSLVGIPVEGQKEGRLACYVAEKGQAFLLRVPTSPDDAPKETTGAGDAFAAGFLFGLLHGKSLLECDRIGDLVARFAIARTGARAGLPSLEELALRYRRVYGRPL